jgi:hydroxycarboxylate dehydrogenase B
VIRLPLFVDAIRRGEMVPGAELRILKDTQASLYFDCQHGLGPVSMNVMLQAAAERAGRMGVCCASSINATYMARLGGYAERLAAKGFVTVIMTNDAGGWPAAAPFGGVQPFLSTNPIAAGLPRRNGPPVLMDMATTTAASGKLRLLMDDGEEAPAGWLMRCEILGVFSVSRSRARCSRSEDFPPDTRGSRWACSWISWRGP